MLCCEHTGSVRANLLSQVVSPSGSYEKALDEAKSFRKNGQLVEAVKLFQKAADRASQIGDLSRQAEALVGKSGCEIRLFRYAQALQSAQHARTFGLKANDRTSAGAADGNILTIYSQLGDFSAARVTASESVALLAASPRKDYYLKALANLGELEFGLHNDELGKQSFLKAIQGAKRSALPGLEALAANNLGSWLTLEGDLVGAQAALNSALEIYQAQRDYDDLAGVYEHLAELEWRKGGVFLKSALAHIDLAFATKSETFKIVPQYYPIHIRGQILLSLGQRDKALLEFRRAVESADAWRQSALPGDTTNTQTVVRLDGVYRDFAQLAAETALEHDDHALAREAFEVLARNRAASLREQLTRSYTGKLIRSPEYFKLLLELQAAQASATLGSDSQQTHAERQTLDQIRAKLSDLENRIGLDQQVSFQSLEKKDQRNALKGIQARLKPSEALFSFSLGEQKSYLWAVTSSDVRLYDLPKQDIIAHQAQAFSHAVSINSPEELGAGRALSRSLFANIAPSLKRKRNWLLTPDGALLDKVPFSYLPAVFENTEKPLIASHTIRLLPSAHLLQTSTAKARTGCFVGVADPIYNLADSRRDRTKGLKVRASSTVLGRLVASEVEIKSSAAECGLPETKMLTGKNASGECLREVTRSSPAILHFAVHVISPRDFPQEAALALSLTKESLPELLTAESVATYRVPGSLVVLSGCASQQGEILPGAGLVGLSRGWLLAGAAAVVVSAWPTPDASGSFFPTFYAHYRQATGSVGMRAATALELTQLDMQRSTGYQSEPKFWAAYSIISKE